MFVARRLVLSSVIVFLPEHPVLQIGIFSCMSIFSLAYLFTHRPFKESNLAKIELTNQIFVMLLIYLSLAFTDLNPHTSSREVVGVAYCVSILLVILINMFFIVY